MSIVIDDIAQYLAANGVGTLGTNLFEALLPPSPDSAVAIIETTGLKPIIDVPLSFPAFQILVRSTAFDTGHTQVDLIKTLLHNQYNRQFVTNGIYFYFTRLTAEPGYLGQDSTGRDLWSMNFETQRR